MFEISDDDDSFNGPEQSKMVKNRDDSIISISSDEESATSRPNMAKVTDDEETVEVAIVQKGKAINDLFLSKNTSVEAIKKKTASKVLFPASSQTNDKPKISTSRDLMIFDVKVTMPVQPYKCQLVLMRKIVEGIKKSRNCILESPTGSGKTLALLCGVLAWQQYELNRISQEQAKNHAEHYFKDYPQSQKENVTNYIASPVSKKSVVNLENLFSKNGFGEKSIYQKPEDNVEPSTSKRTSPYMDLDESNEDASTNGTVNIHGPLKRRRQGSVEPEGTSTPAEATTPKKTIPIPQQKTPEDVRVPTIYYGARTHTQLKQVIKEFRRTRYCGLATMSLLSSRDNSCIKEYNSAVWKSREDMCRACVKSVAANESRKVQDTNCKYYDNRSALHHGTLPPAFDIEDLVEAGNDREACPYYAARAMAKTANIIFCPYNYLIDPCTRSSMQINLDGSIVVIDEAHNIENNLREAATFQFTHNKVQDSLKELEKVAEYRFANQDVLSYIDELIITLKSWDDWFRHQMPLINSAVKNDNKCVYGWSSRDFNTTLDNHNIGYKQFNSFQSSAEILCRRLREDPRTLYGVTDTTSRLLETLSIGLGYFFRNECKHMEDYKPVLECDTNEVLTLYLYCLNPGIVMETLKVARCIILTSGTLTPMAGMEAELGTTFPLTASPDHVISSERVWVGVVSGERGTEQRYTAQDMKQLPTLEHLGNLVRRVCELTPHGVLCFLPSYHALYTFKERWQNTGVWRQLQQLKHVFIEQRNSTHNEMMDDFVECVASPKGALLFAVYRGKVAEGMDFKDHQARAVICVSIPYLSRFDIAVKAKVEYNNNNYKRGLLTDNEWMQVQAYRALNQAVGRCVRHRGDWGAVLLVDARYTQPSNTKYLSKWVQNFLGKNYHTYESLVNSDTGLAQFMERMKISDEQDNSK